MFPSLGNPLLHVSIVPILLLMVYCIHCLLSVEIKLVPCFLLSPSSSPHEQQLNNLQLAHQAHHSKLKNFIDSKIRVLNNNTRTTRGTVAGGFALQNNRQLRTLNDPAAHLLDEVIQPACIFSKQPTSVLHLWQEYKSGLNGKAK
jgi:hypothetical protein